MTIIITVVGCFLGVQALDAYGLSVDDLDTANVTKFAESSSVFCLGPGIASIEGWRIIRAKIFKRE